MNRITNAERSFLPVNPGSKCIELLENQGIKPTILPIYNNIVPLFEKAEDTIKTMDDATVKCLFKEISLLNKNVTMVETKRFIARNKKKLVSLLARRESQGEGTMKGTVLKVSAPTRFIDLI